MPLLNIWVRWAVPTIDCAVSDSFHIICFSFFFFRNIQVCLRMHNQYSERRSGFAQTYWIIAGGSVASHSFIVKTHCDDILSCLSSKACLWVLWISSYVNPLSGLYCQLLYYRFEESPCGSWILNWTHLFPYHRGWYTCFHSLEASICNVVKTSLSFGKGNVTGYCCLFFLFLFFTHCVR